MSTCIDADHYAERLRQLRLAYSAEGWQKEAAGIEAALRMLATEPDWDRTDVRDKHEEAVWIARIPARRTDKMQMIREVLAAAHMHSLREPLGPRPEPEAARVWNDERDKVLQRVIEQAEQWARTKKEKDRYERNGRPLTIAVDFDGTLCDNKWPEIGAEHWGAIRWCQAAKAGGAKLILWTNRAGERLREAVAWCEAHGLRFDAVNENLPEVVEAFGGDTRKIVADIYLDDKVLAADTVEQVMRGIPAQE